MTPLCRLYRRLRLFKALVGLPVPPMFGVPYKRVSAGVAWEVASLSIPFWEEQP